jgi:hypothetical protein
MGGDMGKWIGSAAAMTMAALLIAPRRSRTTRAITCRRTTRWARAASIRRWSRSSFECATSCRRCIPSRRSIGSRPASIARRKPYVSGNPRAIRARSTARRHDPLVPHVRALEAGDPQIAQQWAQVHGLVVRRAEQKVAGLPRGSRYSLSVVAAALTSARPQPTMALWSVRWL